MCAQRAPRNGVPEAKRNALWDRPPLLEYVQQRTSETFPRHHEQDRHRALRARIYCWAAHLRYALKPALSSIFVYGKGDLDSLSLLALTAVLVSSANIPWSNNRQNRPFVSSVTYALMWQNCSWNLGWIKTTRWRYCPNVQCFDKARRFLTLSNVVWTFISWKRALQKANFCENCLQVSRSILAERRWGLRLMSCCSSSLSKSGPPGASWLRLTWGLRAMLGNGHQSRFPERYLLSFRRQHELFENPVPKLCRHSSQGGQSWKLVFASLCAAIRMIRWALDWCLSFESSSYVICMLEEDGCKSEVDRVPRVLSRWYALI